MEKNNHAKTLVKGVIVGSTMVIPGVSGGTMAIILGIYKSLIHAVTNLKKEFKSSVILLGEFAAAGLIGFLLFSGLVEKLLNRFELPTMFFFIGTILGGLPLLVKESQTDFKSLNQVIKGIIAVAGGTAAVLLIGRIPQGMLSHTVEFSAASLIMIFITGVVISIALVLPGISTSHMLLILGMYEFIITIKDHFRESIGYVALLGISVIIGVFLITKPLEFLMDKYPSVTYLAIIGFVAGSVIDIFPGLPHGLEILWCILTMTAGFLAINKLSKI